MVSERLQLEFLKLLQKPPSTPLSCRGAGPSPVTLQDKSVKGACVRACVRPSKSYNKGLEQLSEGEAVAGWWWGVVGAWKQPREAASRLWGWRPREVREPRAGTQPWQLRTSDQDASFGDLRGGLDPLFAASMSTGPRFLNRTTV